MNGINLTSKFDDVNAGYSTMSAPELGGAFAGANSASITMASPALDNTNTFDHS